MLNSKGHFTNQSHNFLIIGKINTEDNVKLILKTVNAESLLFIDQTLILINITLESYREAAVLWVWVVNSKTTSTLCNTPLK